MFFDGCTLASDFGQYRYSKYIGLSNQIYANRMAQNQMMRRTMMYYQNPTHNIRFPNKYSRYPNIEKNGYSVNYQYRTGYGYRYY